MAYTNDLPYIRKGQCLKDKYYFMFLFYFFSVCFPAAVISAPCEIYQYLSMDIHMYMYIYQGEQTCMSPTNIKG